MFPKRDNIVVIGNLSRILAFTHLTPLLTLNQHFVKYSGIREDEKEQARRLKSREYYRKSWRSDFKSPKSVRSHRSEVS